MYEETGNCHAESTAEHKEEEKCEDKNADSEHVSYKNVA